MKNEDTELTPQSETSGIGLVESECVYFKIKNVVFGITKITLPFCTINLTRSSKAIIQSTWSSHRYKLNRGWIFLHNDTAPTLHRTRCLLYIFQT